MAVRYKKLQLALLFTTVWIWVQLEVYTNTGQLWLSIRSTLMPTLLTLGIYGVGELILWIKNMEQVTEILHVPEWIYEDP